ncbi:lysine transporter LysE [Thalassotalea insulae]|uniref:Lysine transporter LysE n=1 Tax=Thalassotalea insulae TaxID=2056778 RepID=A0ABQ6GR39_9GAMM|nr:LysE family translocator [Thalassotalea insulae]GLX78371.1 lysine transporter LysE [Thalassotalea insulae]
MDLLNLFIFIPACFALNMAPGPNNLLAMNNARCYGISTALIAGFGRLFAFSIMIVLAASGLAAVLYASETIFLMIKVIGAAYLLWIAIQLWHATAAPATEHNSSGNYLALARQEFTLAAGNPKAILIFTAFLPQFVDPNANINNQFLQLGAIFLLLELIAITIYGLFGRYLRHWFTQAKTAKRFNRACAGFLGLSGANLLLAEQ